MLLITAATRYEMEAFGRSCPPGLNHERLITGIGPVEAALHLSLALGADPWRFSGVVNFGTAGAYFQKNGTPAAGLLDICLAESEVLGDFGICSEQTIERITGKILEVHDFFSLDAALLDQAANLLAQAGIPVCRGPFITVNCVSATRTRGNLLAHRHQAICENMEGAAAARVCQHFGVPLLELRCVSNYVEDRNRQKWKMKEACSGCGEAVAIVLQGLQEKLTDD